MIKTPSPQYPRSTPPLENGDRLTRHEFERRYEADPRIKKAELIEGVVYVASPLRFASHAEPHAQLVAWLSIYQINTPGLRLGIEPTLQLDADNEPQPDGVLLMPEKAGGQSRFTEDDYVEGAPELVAEIAASSTAIDLHAKKNAYRRSGIREYIVWQIFEKKLDWSSLREGQYVSLQADAAGIVQSQIFPGLWLAVPALLQGEMQQVLVVLQQGLSSEEHRAFVQQLASPAQQEL